MWRVLQVLGDRASDCHRQGVRVVGSANQLVGGLEENVFAVRLPKGRDQQVSALVGRTEMPVDSPAGLSGLMQCPQRPDVTAVVMERDPRPATRPGQSCALRRSRSPPREIHTGSVPVCADIGRRTPTGYSQQLRSSWLQDPRLSAACRETSVWRLVAPTGVAQAPMGAATKSGRPCGTRLRSTTRLPVGVPLEVRFAGTESRRRPDQAGLWGAWFVGFALSPVHRVAPATDPLPEWRTPDPCRDIGLDSSCSSILV
jgi:hypothetical protein